MSVTLTSSISSILQNQRLDPWEGWWLNQATHIQVMAVLPTIISWERSVRGDAEGTAWMGTSEGGGTKGPWKPRQSSRAGVHRRGTS